MVKIIDRDDRIMIFNGNTVLGYVEDSRLYGFDPDNYAVEICTIDNRNEIATRFAEWQERR
jgi:hypothetical protein